MDTACEENEVLRNKLGLSAGEEVDVSHLRHRKNVEIEQLRAVNRELDKQVRTYLHAPPSFLRILSELGCNLMLLHRLAVC